MKIGDYVQIKSNSPRTAIRDRIGRIKRINVDGLRKGIEVNDYIQIEIHPINYKVDRDDFNILSLFEINKYRNYHPTETEKISRSCLKGHMIYFDTHYKVFRYTDDDSLVCENSRPCGNCGKETTEDDHDYCIANLPGVKNACCGHGTNEAYVMFENGIVIRGKIEYPY